MNPRQKKYRLFFIPAIFTILLSIHPTASAMGILNYGGTLNIALTVNELSVDPNRPLPPVLSLISENLYEPLNSPSGFDSLASWTSSTGHITLHLVRNIVVNGTDVHPLTASNVNDFLLERLYQRWDARYELRFINGIGDSESFPDITLFDDRTLEINTRQATAYGTFMPSFASPSLRFALPSDQDRLSGTGPFSIQNISGQSATLSASTRHHAGRPYLDSVAITAIPGIDNAVLDFGRGTHDALVLTSNDRDKFETSSRASLANVEKIGDAMLVLVINPLRIHKTSERRSFALAIDQEGICDVILGDGSSPVSDFYGGYQTYAPWADRLDEARNLRDNIANPVEEFTLLVCDDSAATEAASRIKANYESLGVPVNIENSSGPLMLSIKADAILLAVNIPGNGEGALPQVLSMIDRANWWNFLGMALPQNASAMLKKTRNCDLDLDPDFLAEALKSAGLIVPVAKYEILFAPSPEVSLVPDEIYPGPFLWRAFFGQIPPAPEENNGNNEGADN
ncbi:MAG TPA: ABC transporter substrate-binding protein [bacterium]|jgi:ABC-type transport system substrate-binding protein